MPVLNDEIPDDDDFDNMRDAHKFTHITPEDFVRGSEHDNPPGWLPAETITTIRQHTPITYVEIVPVRTDDLGRVQQIGFLLRALNNKTVERTFIAGRVLFHETIREAICRNISKDLGDIALPILPQNLQPFTIAEFFPTPGVCEFYDPRQHAIALCYVITVPGDCKPQDDMLDVEWHEPTSPDIEEWVEHMANGHGEILRRALAWIDC